MPHPVVDAAERFRRLALARERATATRLVQAYGRVYRAMGDSVDALAESAIDRELSANQIRRLGSLRALQSQVANQVGIFGIYAEQSAIDAMDGEIRAGLADAEALVAAHFDAETLRSMGIAPGTQAELMRGFNRLPVEAIETMIGMTGEDSPLHDALVNQLGPAVAENMTEAMVNGIAMGKHPRVIARQCMGAGLTWALTTVRTAQLNAYRTANLATYRANSKYVTGWRWHAHLGPRTCVSCLALHGSVHPLDEPMQDHHNGRCSMTPVIDKAYRMGIPEPDYGDGETYFLSLTEKEQRAIMGSGVYDGYKAGRWKFKDLTDTYDDHVYGTMHRAPTMEHLSELYQ